MGGITNSRSTAHAYFPLSLHRKTNSSSDHPAESRTLTGKPVTRPLDTIQEALPNQSFQMQQKNGLITISIPKKRRQNSNGSQVSVDLQKTTSQPGMTITTTTTITQNPAPVQAKAETGLRRKWVVQETEEAKQPTQPTRVVTRSKQTTNSIAA